MKFIRNSKKKCIQKLFILSYSHFCSLKIYKIGMDAKIVKKTQLRFFFFFNEIYKIKISIDLFYWGILSNELRL